MSRRPHIAEVRMWAYGLLKDWKRSDGQQTTIKDRTVWADDLVAWVLQDDGALPDEPAAPAAMQRIAA